MSVAQPPARPISQRFLLAGALLVTGGCGWRPREHNATANCTRERVAAARFEAAQRACERDRRTRAQRDAREQAAREAACTARCTQTATACRQVAPGSADAGDCERQQAGCQSDCALTVVHAGRFSEWAQSMESPCPGEPAREALRRCEDSLARRRAAADEADEMRRAHLAEARRDPARASAFAAARREANAAMVAIPSADFVVDPPQDPPRSRVSLEAFFMDRLEVTAGAYAVCVEAGSCQPPRNNGPQCNFGVPGRRDHPINCVTAAEAGRYCHWREARLPTEAEWDWAARGRDRRPFPWGPEPPDSRAHWSGGCGIPGCRGGTAVVGTHPLDRSPFGLLDLGGSVREWVSDRFEGGGEALRGGSWHSFEAEDMRCTQRDTGDASGENYDGFRCARDR